MLPMVFIEAQIGLCHVQAIEGTLNMVKVVGIQQGVGLAGGVNTIKKQSQPRMGEG